MDENPNIQNESEKFSADAVEIVPVEIVDPVAPEDVRQHAFKPLRARCTGGQMTTPSGVRWLIRVVALQTGRTGNSAAGTPPPVAGWRQWSWTGSWPPAPG